MSQPDVPLWSVCQKRKKITIFGTWSVSFRVCLCSYVRIWSCAQYEREIPSCDCIYIWNESVCLQVPGIIFVLRCLSYTPTGVPSSVGTPHLTIIACCNHKWQNTNTTDTDQTRGAESETRRETAFYVFINLRLFPPICQQEYHIRIFTSFGQMCGLLWRHLFLWWHHSLSLTRKWWQIHTFWRL